MFSLASTGAYVSEFLRTKKYGTGLRLRAEEQRKRIGLRLHAEEQRKWIGSHLCADGKGRNGMRLRAEGKGRNWYALAR